MPHSLSVGRVVNFTGFSANKHEISIGKKEILYVMSLCGKYILPILQQQQMDKSKIEETWVAQVRQGALHPTHSLKARGKNILN